MKTPRNRHTIVIRSTYSTSGGVERVALSTIRGLLDSGDRVTLLTMPQQQWPVSHRRLTVVELGLHRTHRLVQAWSFNRAVLRYLRHSSADCIFSLDKVARFTHLHAGGS